METNMLRNTEKVTGVIDGSTLFIFLMCQGSVFWLKLCPCSLRSRLPSFGMLHKNSAWRI